MKFDPVVGAAVPAFDGRELIQSVPGLPEIADIEIHEFGRFPGPHMTPLRMMQLSMRIREALGRRDVDGVVVTHGTDTLEETAYLVDLTVRSEKPIVFVGAMRTRSEVGWDGPANLLAGTSVAASDSARGLGVVIVMHETVLAAAEATKTHTESFDSFQSPDFGPLGVVDRGEVVIRRSPIGRMHLDTTEIAEPVWLVKIAAGMDSTLINAGIDAGARGLVIEALGRGNVPPDCVEGIKRAISQSVPVVLSSRCLRGRVFESYGYDGGGKQLVDLGVIKAGFLNGQKARIKLALALSLTDSSVRIAEMFTQ